MEAIAEPVSEQIARIEPDWNSVRERYLAGEELASIAVDNSTTANAISIRAHREKWRDEQLKLMLRDELLISKEVRGCLLVSVLKESRWFQRQEPSNNPVEADLWSKVRSRLIDTSAKLMHWDADPVAAAKPAKCLDV